MRPKEYYDQFTFQEDAKYIFTLMPREFENRYIKYIKEPIETIKLDEGEVICESYQNFEAGTDQIDEVWKSIQKSGIIIANITDFKPNVMLELGVALMKKGRVILIAEKSLDGKANLPFNISTLGVKFYEPDKLAEFSDWLKGQVAKWITPDEPRIKDTRVIKLMNDVLSMRREKKFDTALLLFEGMDKIESGNWYIYKEWGITYKESNDYQRAYKKLEKALEFAKNNTHKSEINTELGVVYHENNMENKALIAFEKAENLDRDNSKLYEKWAYLYFKIGKYNDAMNKMMLAVKLDGNNKGYKWRFEFYSRKFLEPNFTMGLKSWLDMKKKGPVSPPIVDPPRKKDFFTNDPRNFTRFKNRHKSQEEVEGTVLKVVPHVGIFVGFEFDIFGLILKHRLPDNFDVNDRYSAGKKIRAKILFYNDNKLQIDLALAV